VPDDLDRVPLLRAFPAERLRGRQRGEERGALADLPLQPLDDRIVGDEIDVVEVVRQALVGGGTARVQGRAAHGHRIYRVRRRGEMAIVALTGADGRVSIRA